MPSKAPKVLGNARDQLEQLGRAIRERRKALRVSGAAAAESAGMSRVTWYRIEKGAASVAAAAYANAAAVLGLALNVCIPSVAGAQQTDSRAGWLPARVRIADYPQLQGLAWQLSGVEWLSPQEALSIYERNWRHVDEAALTATERALIDALRLAFTNVAIDVR